MRIRFEYDRGRRELILRNADTGEVRLVDGFITGENCIDSVEVYTPFYNSKAFMLLGKKLYPKGENHE